MLLALLVLMGFFRESQGSFEYGNYRREAEDLRSVLQHLRGENREISAIIGHSKGLNKNLKTKVDLMIFFNRKKVKYETLERCYCWQVGVWYFCMQQSTRM